MSRPHRRLIVAAVAVVVTGLATAAVALPGPAACAVVGLAGLHSLGDGLLTDSESTADQQGYRQLVRDARERIGATFGAVESRPLIVFFNDASGLGPFRLNRYGSTQMIGSRACVMVGPAGQSIDVVAHELMHGEVHHRVGYRQRLLTVPTWFDEGVAMQVDYRGRYALSLQDATASDADVVRDLTTGSRFFVENDEALTRHYAFAKAVIASWVERVGPAALYPRLERLRAGEPFDEVLPVQELALPVDRRPASSH